MRDTMYRTCLGILLSIVIAVPSFPQPQQQPTPQPDRVVVISFFAPIIGPSVNQLLMVVNQQVAQGAHKIGQATSPGGDTASAFTAYNFLRGLQGVQFTTFNVGNVDSAAMLLYCAGKNRYSLPGPTRFLIHGNSLTIPSNMPMDALTLEAQLQQLKSLNQMVIQAVASASNKKQVEIENAVKGQVILTPEQAKEWGLVQEIKKDFIEPGVVPIQVSIDLPIPSGPPKTFEFSSATP